MFLNDNILRMLFVVVYDVFDEVFEFGSVVVNFVFFVYGDFNVDVVVVDFGDGVDEELLLKKKLC